MSKNRGKSKLSKNILFNANKHVFHCEKSLATLFYGQPSYKKLPQYNIFTSFHLNGELCRVLLSLAVLQSVHCLNASNGILLVF
jgi:hypothetical protein